MAHPELAGTRVLPVQFAVGGGEAGGSRVLYTASGRRIVEDTGAVRDIDREATAAAVGPEYLPAPSAAEFPALPGGGAGGGRGGGAPRAAHPVAVRHGRARVRAEDFPALGGGGFSDSGSARYVEACEMWGVA